MTFVEEKGNKIAAVLCLASVLPMAGTVYAMETKTMAGNSEKVVSTAQNESDLKTTNYIEDSDVDSTISVKSDISKEITNVVQEAVKENSVEEHYVPKMEVKETPAVEETMENTTVQNVQEQETSNVQQEQNETIDVDTSADAPSQDIENAALTTDVSNQENDIQAPQENSSGTIEGSDGEDDSYNSGYDNSIENNDSNTWQDNSNPTTDNSANDISDNQGSVSDVEASTEVPSGEQTAESANSQYSDLNSRIVEAAKGLVDVTNGQWCTQIVQQSLAGAGVSDALQLWPDQYAGQYGYYTNDPQPGNLVYYNNGGRGVDHIAVYIGNGLAVHGNYWIDGQSKTIIASVNVPGAAAPQYIQVVR